MTGDRCGNLPGRRKKTFGQDRTKKPYNKKQEMEIFMAKKLYEKCGLKIVVVDFNEITTDILTNSGEIKPDETLGDFDSEWAKGGLQ